MTPTPARAIELFFSYSHRDEGLRDDLEKHLSVLMREGVITSWYDRKIGAGREWEGQISDHLESAHVILLLISADFLASAYCYDKEMTRAMERHESREARVIPVILRDSDWKGAPFGKLQAVPKDAKPVTSWANRDEAFADVARSIRKAVAELSANPPEPSVTTDMAQPAAVTRPEILTKDRQFTELLAQEIPPRSKDVVGESRTTATIIGQAILNEGLKSVASGAEPINLKRGIDAGVEVAIDALRDLAQPVSTRKQMAQVAASYANDATIGEIIAEVMEKVGKHGMITVDEGTSNVIEIAYLEGMGIAGGYISPYFARDSETGEATVEDAYILITDKTVSDAGELVPILESVLKVTKNFVMICGGCDGAALEMLLANTRRGIINALAIKTPYSGNERRAILGDIAVVTGGKLISEELGLKLKSVGIEDLGQADRVKASEDATITFGGRGSWEDIDARTQQIKAAIDDASSEVERERREYRLSELNESIAVIKVGAPTAIELKARKVRVVDALFATRAAVEEGVVPGGGTALLRAQAPLEKLAEKLAGDEQTGAYILRNALEEPLRISAEKAGQEATVVVDRVRASKEPGFGYDAKTGGYCDLYASGMIDPVKVIRIVLEKAASIATTVLTQRA